MTQTRLSEQDAKLLGDAADMISQALAWGDTDEGHDYWDEVYEHLRNKAANRTSDGKPYVEPEPPLTDKDACVWPRLLVMVRDKDSEPWKGPFRYFGKDDDKACPFVAVSAKGRSQIWQQARRATPEEIEAAHGNS